MQFSVFRWIKPAQVVVLAALEHYRPTSANEILKNKSQYLTGSTYITR